jgi:hypothetical protein
MEDSFPTTLLQPFRRSVGTRSSDAAEEYFQLQPGDSQLRRLECGGADVLQRRSEHGGARLLYGQPGHADGSKLALRQAHGRTVLCRATGCGALVDLLVAKRAARRRWHTAFAPGDGCASATCSARHWALRFRQRQAAMASDLRSGARVLVVWPPTTAPRVDQWAVSAELAGRVAEESAAARPRPLKVPRVTVRSSQFTVRNSEL